MARQRLDPQGVGVGEDAQRVGESPVQGNDDGAGGDEAGQAGDVLDDPQPASPASPAATAPRTIAQGSKLTGSREADRVRDHDRTVGEERADIGEGGADGVERSDENQSQADVDCGGGGVGEQGDAHPPHPREQRVGERDRGNQREDCEKNEQHGAGAGVVASINELD